MKKTFLPILFLFPILISCSNNLSTNNSNLVEEDINRIVVNSPKETFTINDKVNLDNYVSLYLSNGNKAFNQSNYEAKLVSVDLAKLENHTLTILKEGTIYVDISTNNAKARFTCSAFSSLKAKFASDIKDVSKNYYLETLKVDSNYEFVIEDDSYVGSNNGSLHTDNYFAIDQTIFNQGKEYTGKIQIKDKTYPLTMSSKNGDSLQIGPGEDKADLSSYKANSEFPIDPNNLILGKYLDETTNKNEEALILPSKFSQEFLQKAFGYDNLPSSYAFADSYISYSSFKYLDEDNKPVISKMPIMMFNVTYQNQVSTLTAFAIHTKNNSKTNISSNNIDEYIKKGIIPEKIDNSPIKNIIEEYFTSKNYTLNISSNWLDKNKNIVLTPPSDASNHTDTMFSQQSTLIINKDKMKFSLINGFGQANNRGFILYENTQTGISKTTNINTASKPNELTVNNNNQNTIDTSSKDIFTKYEKYTLQGVSTYLNDFSINGKTTVDNITEYTIYNSKNLRNFLGSFLNYVPIFGDQLKQTNSKTYILNNQEVALLDYYTLLIDIDNQNNTFKINMTAPLTDNLEGFISWNFEFTNLNSSTIQ